MSESLIELLFWCVVFVALFVGLRKLQRRKKAGDVMKAASDISVERGADSQKDGNRGGDDPR